MNSGIFNPLLIDRDPEAGDESDEEAISARAPPGLDARVPLELPASGGMDTPPAPEPDPPVIVDDHHDLETEVALPKEPEETKVTNVAWLEAHVSSEEAKQKVITLMMVPDVKGFTTRGVTVSSVPGGSQTHLITSRHHVPSQAEYRRTASQVREEDSWYWTGPVEHWASLIDPQKR